MNTKGQLGGLKPIIFSLIIAGVLIGAGFFIFAEFRDQTDDEAFSVTNETDAFINQSGYTVAQATKEGFANLAIVQARNVTGDVIPLGNLSVNSATGVITNATADTWFDVHLDYTFTAGEEAFIALNDTIEAFDTVPNLLPLVVLIAMIVIILGLVFSLPGANKA